MRSRDYSLDAIKGLACVMMILAHATLSPQVSPLVKNIVFFGSFAPSLFYAVSGVTTIFQAKKSSFASIAIFYIMFAFLGLTIPGLLNAHFWHDIIPWNILQVIAVGVITVAAVEIYLKPKKSLYFALAIATFALHYLISRPLHYHSPVYLQFLFDTEQWLPVFFTGIFAYHIQNRFNLILGLSHLSLIVCLFLAGTHLDYTSKDNMSLSYFILSQTVVFLAFYLFREKSKISQIKILTYFGKHSLLFLYVHFFILLKFDGIKFRQVFWVWSGALVLSWLMMKLCQYFNQYIEKYFDNIAVWIGMIVCICTLPIVISQTKYVVLGEILLGVVFASNYHVLSQLVKRKLFEQDSTSIGKSTV